MEALKCGNRTIVMKQEKKPFIQSHGVTRTVSESGLSCIIENRAVGQSYYLCLHDTTNRPRNFRGCQFTISGLICLQVWLQRYFHDFLVNSTPVHQRCQPLSKNFCEIQGHQYDQSACLQIHKLGVSGSVHPQKEKKRYVKLILCGIRKNFNFILVNDLTCHLVLSFFVSVGP